MAGKSNTRKSNVLKEPPKTAARTKAKSTRKKTTAKKSAKTSTITFNPQLKRIIGFFFLLCAVYLLLAFTSFFTNWFEAISPGEVYKDHSETVKNWTGKLGEFLSNWFVKRGVGLGAYFFPIVFLGLGLKMLLNVRLFKLWVWFQLIVTSLLWLPMLLNLIFPSNPMNILAGEAGKQLNSWVLPYLGNIGLIFLLIFIPAIFILIDFRFTFKKKERKTKIDPTVPNNSKESGGDKYNTVEFAVEEDEPAIRLYSIRIWAGERKGLC